LLKGESVAGCLRRSKIGGEKKNSGGRGEAGGLIHTGIGEGEGGRIHLRGVNYKKSQGKKQKGMNKC